MIDFILAGVLYMAIMFIVSFSISFVTIGIVYGTVLFFRRFRNWGQPFHAALK